MIASNKNVSLLSILGTIFKCRLLTNVLSYIDTQTLLLIVKFGNNKKKFQQLSNKLHKQQIVAPQLLEILKRIKSYYFIREHLNKTDRTMYFSFYEQPLFLKIQTQLSQRLTQDHSDTFCSQLDQFQIIFQTILANKTLCQNELQEFKRILIDPSLPLPKLKRQNQGMYCRSSFQLFLVGLQYKSLNQEDSYFQQFKAAVKQNQQNLLKYFIQIFKQKHSHHGKLKTIHQVRYTPYEISHSNYKNYLLSSAFFIHNFIVYLFALTQLLIQSMHSFIKILDDPLLRFIELMTRYSIFRNFVIEISENLSFLFQQYDSLYSDVTRESINNRPKYSFWRPAMTKWYLKMNEFHQESSSIYCFLLFKMRFTNIQQFIQESSIFKSNLTPIRNLMGSISFQFQLYEKIYATQGSSIQQFVQNNSQSNQILTAQYIEYMIDLSINQQTVHWCGHSQHQLETPYNHFQISFVDNTMGYFKCLEKTIVGKTAKQSSKLFNLILQEEISFLQNNGLKPLTLRKLIKLVNQQYIFKSQMQSQLTQVFIDFSFKDQNLKYYNEKAKIECSVNEQQKCFFSISPLFTAEQILVKSIDTNDSDQLSKDSDSYQYISDNDQSEYFNDESSPDKFKMLDYTCNQHMQNLVIEDCSSDIKPKLINMVILEKQKQIEVCNQANSFVQGAWNKNAKI